MYSGNQPIIVEPKLPLLPMGLFSPACSWASIDDELNYVFYIAKGRGIVMAQGGIMRFAGPCAVLVPAGMTHNSEFELNASGMALTITATHLRSVLQREPDFAVLFSAPVIIPLTSEQLTWPLAQLAHELSCSDIAHTAAADAHLLSILVLCARAMEYSQKISTHYSKAPSALVTQFQELIEQNYRNNMSLAQYALALGVSPGRLREASLAVTGTLPHQLIQQRVLQDAQRVLLNSSLTIAQTAYYLGFNDPAYFSRFFTKALGVSPRLFRRNSRHN